MVAWNSLGERVAAVIRRSVAAIDKNQPVTSIVTMNKIVSRSVLGRRITLIVHSVFSGLAVR